MGNTRQPRPQNEKPYMRYMIANVKGTDCS